MSKAWMGWTIAGTIAQAIQLMGVKMDSGVLTYAIGLHK
jgi:hypothetical protein